MNEGCACATLLARAASELESPGTGALLRLAPSVELTAPDPCASSAVITSLLSGAPPERARLRGVESQRGRGWRDLREEQERDSEQGEVKQLQLTSHVAVPAAAVGV